MSVIAAVDIGTTSLRVGLFDVGAGSDSAPLTVTQQPLVARFPQPRRVEQDPAAFVSATVDLLADACGQVSVPVTAVESIGIACQRGTFLAWDTATGKPITHAIGWQDSRTQAQVDELRAAGIPVNTMASCTKVKWVLDEIPAAQQALAAGTLAVGTLDTWLIWNLTDRRAFITDPSNASATGLYDPASGDWSAAALDFFGIDRAILPEITLTAGRDGDTHQWAKATIRASAGDQQAACFAHGLKTGEAKLTLGTSAMLDVAIGAKPRPGPPGAYALPLWRLRSSGETTVELYCMEANIAAAGATFEWLVRVGLLPSIDQLDAIAAAGRPGPIIVPALAGLGTPHDNSAVRGLFSGIGLETTAADLVRGAVDGVALRAAEICDALDVGETLKVDGGLTRSPVMLQRLADLTGRVILPAIDPEVTMRGAAMLAAPVDIVSGQPVPYGDPVEPTISEDKRQTACSRFAEAVESAMNGT